jgi:hypothetical protein
VGAVKKSASERSGAKTCQKNKLRFLDGDKYINWKQKALEKYAQFWPLEEEEEEEEEEEDGNEIKNMLQIHSTRVNTALNLQF